MGNELVDSMQIPIETNDADVQKKLDQLHNSEGIRDKRIPASKQVLTTDEDSCNAVLAVAGSNIHVDSQFKKNLFDFLKEDKQYCELIQQLEEEGQPDEIILHQARDPPRQ